MQELQLIFTGTVIAGGTTKPFTILALDESDNAHKYLVKAFTKEQLKQNASVAKEIICCELAKMFDLNIPDYGVINFNREDLENVYDSERLDAIDLGAKFCSKYAEQYSIFAPTASKNFLKDYEILNIFAFDVFLLNTDRGGHRNKPNLLINDNDLMIIDHELTFPFINDQYISVDYEKRLRLYQHQKHVLLKYIKQLKVKDRIFDEFLLSLSSLNLIKITKIFEDLDKYNIEYFDKKYFIDYFAWAKNNTHLFERYLLAMIK